MAGNGIYQLIKGKRDKVFECLRDFFQKLQELPQDSAGQIASDMISFMRAKSGTIRRWESGEAFPKGLNLIRVIHYLKKFGYTLIEVENISPELELLGDMVSRMIIHPEDIIGTENLFLDVSELCRALRNGRKVSEARLGKIKNYCSAYGSAVSSGEGVLNKEITLIECGSAENHPQKNNESPVVISCLKILDGVSDILIPELELLLSGGKENERIALRDKANVFGLSNKAYKLQSLLNSLCSETARKMNGVENHQKSEGGVK